MERGKGLSDSESGFGGSYALGGNYFARLHMPPLEGSANQFKVLLTDYLYPMKKRILKRLCLRHGSETLGRIQTQDKNGQFRVKALDQMFITYISHLLLNSTEL